MFTRNRDQAETVEWGGGTSDRLLVEKDGMGFAVCHTIVKQGTSSKLEYRNHLEACYCISGSGQVVEKDGTVHEITPGTIYVLDEHDRTSCAAARRRTCTWSPSSTRRSPATRSTPSPRTATPPTEACGSLRSPTAPQRRWRPPRTPPPFARVQAPPRGSGVR